MLWLNYWVFWIAVFFVYGKYKRLLAPAFVNIIYSPQSPVFVGLVSLRSLLLSVICGLIWTSDKRGGSYHGVCGSSYSYIVCSQSEVLSIREKKLFYFYLIPKIRTQHDTPVKWILCSLFGTVWSCSFLSNYCSIQKPGRPVRSIRVVYKQFSHLVSAFSSLPRVLSSKIIQNMRTSSGVRWVCGTKSTSSRCINII